MASLVGSPGLISAPAAAEVVKKKRIAVNLGWKLVLGGTFFLMGVFIFAAAWNFVQVSSLAPTDDSLIGVRPGEILAKFGVLSFNVSGPRVEANSSLLFTLITAVGFLFLDLQGVMYWYLPAVNTVFAVISCALIYLLCRESGVRRGWALAGAVLLAALPVTWFWVASGMESTLNSMLEIWLVLLALVSLRREDRVMTALLALCTILLLMVRPDGFLFPFCISVFLALAKGKWRLASKIAIPMVVGWVVLALWRLHYYGQIFPNPVYAKITGTLSENLLSGWEHWQGTAVATGIWLPTLFLLWRLLLEIEKVAHKGYSICASRKWQNPFDAITLGPWLALAMLTAWFLHAGDGYNVRQILTIFPLGIWLMVMVSDKAQKFEGKEALTRLAVAGFIMAYMPIAWFPATFDFHGPFDRPAFKAMDREANIIAALNRDYPEWKSIAADKLGFIGALAGTDKVVCDLLGLADLYLARLERKYAPGGKYIPGHCKYDLAYSLGEQKADVNFHLIYRASDLGHQFIDGLNRPLMEKEGYVLAYLSSSSSYRCVDVRGDEEKVQRLLSQGGFNGAVYVQRHLPYKGQLMLDDTKIASKQ